MANYDTFRIGANAVPQKKQYVGRQKYFLSKTINFANQNLDAGNADVARILDIEANTIVKGVWVKVGTACATNATIDVGYGSDVNYWGNGMPLDATGVVPFIQTASETFDAGSINDGDEEMEEVAVNGASLGDIAWANLAVDVADLAVTADVTVANQVEVHVLNNTGGAVDLASTTLEVVVNKAPLFANPVLFTSADTIDIKATTDTADVNITTGVITVVAECIDARYLF